MLNYRGRAAVSLRVRFPQGPPRTPWGLSARELLRSCCCVFFPVLFRFADVFLSFLKVILSLSEVAAKLS